ncbi:hypothetical protein [Streptomyces sp. N35]|nr:hypothetical protein [Streptomyces sp. N35]
MTALVLVAVAVLGAVLIFGATTAVVGWALLLAGVFGLMASIDRPRHHH